MRVNVHPASAAPRPSAVGRGRVEDAHGQNTLIARIDEREGGVGAVDPQAGCGEHSGPGLNYGERLQFAGRAVFPSSLTVAVVNQIPCSVETISRVEEDVPIERVVLAACPKRDEYRTVCGERDISERGRALVRWRLARVVDKARCGDVHRGYILQGVWSLVGRLYQASKNATCMGNRLWIPTFVGMT